jgi:hypothetical protein
METDHGYVVATETSLPGVVQLVAETATLSWLWSRLCAAVRTAAAAEAPLSPTKRLTAAVRAPVRVASVSVR